MNTIISRQGISKTNYAPDKADIFTLKACFELEYLLLGELRELLDEPETRYTRPAILLILDRLLANLPRQLKLKSKGGYLSGVLGVFPNWQEQVESLRCEDLARISTLEELRSLVAAGSSFSHIVHETHHQLQLWMQLLAAHRKEERRLIQKATNLDLGGES